MMIMSEEEHEFCMLKCKGCDAMIPNNPLQTCKRPCEVFIKANMKDDQEGKEDGVQIEKDFLPSWLDL
eukprot:scaffold229259_cov17-Tisochrysis_lutea.AAC.1